MIITPESQLNTMAQCDAQAENGYCLFSVSDTLPKNNHHSWAIRDFKAASLLKWLRPCVMPRIFLGTLFAVETSTTVPIVYASRTMEKHGLHLLPSPFLEGIPQIKQIQFLVHGLE